jgi:hypothetical protein
VYPAVLLVLVLRVLVSVARQVRDERNPRVEDGPPGAPGVDASLVIAVVLLVVLGAVGVVLASVAGAIGLVPLLAVAVLLAEPWLLARYVAIPMGWPRAAFWLTRLSTVQWSADRAGGARFAAAWAAVRRRPRDEAAEAWIESSVGERPVTAAMLAAHGLLAASRGDRTEARRLLRAVASFDVRPRPLQRVLSEWLVAEAATRGDWEEVERAAAIPPSTRASELLGATAKRLLDRPDAPDASAFAERWRRTPSLHAEGVEVYRRALHARHRPAPPGVPKADDPLRAALEAHRAASLEAAAVPEAARRWPAALRAAPHLRQQVVDDLADLAERGRLRLASLSDGLGPEIAEVVRGRHLDRLDVAVKALHRRAAEERWLEPVAEAREWIAVATLYEELLAVGGESAARAAYHPLFLALTDLAAELYNTRRQPYLFRAITRWLHEHGARVGDERACELLVRNLEVSKGWSG